MRIYIGPYVNRWVSNVYSRYMNKKYGYYDWPEYETKGLINKHPPAKEVFLEKLEDALQWVYNQTINLYLDKKKRKVDVKIHNYDTWGMDDTLALLIAPMLKQLKETKHGAPYVDDEDVPEELRSTNAEPKEHDYDTDSNHFKRWDWVLDEMHWAFEQQLRDWEADFYEYEHFTPNKESENFGEKMGLRCVWKDDEGRKAHHARMQNGFRLFGKYYSALWD